MSGVARSRILTAPGAPVRRRRPPPRAAAALLGAALVGGTALAAAAAPADETARLAELLQLAPGRVVADVGAGDGEWAVALAERVGAEGRVFATEVDPGLVAKIEAAASAAGRRQVTALLGNQGATGLAPDCCDAILLRLVYHHFVDPAAMRADLARALRPGGRLVIVDTVPQAGWRRLTEVPDRGGHGIRLAELVAEMTADGWTEVERRKRWMGDRDRYAVVFRPAAGAAR